NALVENTVREIREAEAEKEATKAARERLEAFKETVEKRQQKVRGRERARQRRQAPAPPPAAAGPIQLGDQVRLDGGEAVGEVLELDGRDAVVAFGQMTTRAKLDRLSKVGGPRRQRVEVRAPKSGPANDLPIVHARRRIDVRGQRADEAVAEVMRLVDQAVAAGVPSVEVLHGKGTGALREAIREHLAARPDVASFDSAAWNEGGDGVTVAVLG